MAQRLVCQLLLTGDLVQDVVVDSFRLFNRSLMQMSFAHIWKPVTSRAATAVEP